ncbi:chemotaxis protein CheW [Endozoicomonas sp. Mp262]|uniref:chemotaxis protein CheW n=1 Tax=Endozoicomonas sp. Mp262 TaxID=2919499 RepID=UPI0021DA0403
METSPSHPFDELVAIEKQVMQFSTPFPAIETTSNQWSGVSFILNNHHFVVDFREILEILSIPDMTPLPDVQDWVKGIANIRGRIVPIVDLGDFLGRDSPLSTGRRKTLLVEHKETPLGLIVDEVQGMMKFSGLKDEKDVPGELKSAYRPFVTGCFFRDIHHLVFCTRRLLSSHRFLRAARG